MPNCCGSSGGCSCIVQGGSGVAVSGAGTTAAPYVVTVSGTSYNADLPVGRYVQITGDSNSSFSVPKGTEWSYPFWFPGAGRLNRVGFEIGSLSTDSGTVIRFGLRLDNAGLPGAVHAEMSVPAAAAQGGTTGWKELTVDVPCGARYWLSLCNQGSGTNNPGWQQGARHLGGPFLQGGWGGSQLTMAWATGHSPYASSVANASGTLASTAAPSPPGADNTTGGNFPAFCCRRGS